jgi:hypothetical protein
MRHCQWCILPNVPLPVAPSTKRATGSGVVTPYKTQRTNIPPTPARLKKEKKTEKRREKEKREEENREEKKREKETEEKRRKRKKRKKRENVRDEIECGRIIRFCYRR